VSDEKDKPTPPARQPVAHEISAKFEGRGNQSVHAGLAQAAAAKFEGRGNQSVHAGLAQAAAAKFEGHGNLSAVVERVRVLCQRLVSDIKRGRPSPAQFFRDEAQRRGELPPTLTLNALARDLLAWFGRAYPNVRPPKSVRVVEGYVRKLWRAARRT
jgi:hypothetical protein